MRNELEHIELIEKYLRGELSTVERASFEEQLKTDVNLQKEVDLQKDVVKGIERLGVKQTIQKSYEKYKLGKTGLNFGLGIIVLTAIVSAFLWFNGNLEMLDASKNLYAALNENGENIWADADKNLPSQFFTINTSTDTVIETIGGIVMYIPTGSFLDNNGNTISGNIEFEVKEALNTAQIIQGGLSSKSGDRLLESAGMFYVNARKDGETIQINPDKGIYTEVPTDEVNPKMQLFEGKRMDDGSIDWINPSPLEKFLTPVDINSLNFYPPKYESKLAELKQNVSDKKYKDSLYYSFAWEDYEFGTENGKKIFEKQCIACHSIGNGKVVGSDLIGVTKRHSKEWLTKAIRNYNDLIVSSDVEAIKIYNQHGKVLMPPININDEDMNSLLKYIDAKSIQSGLDKNFNLNISNNSDCFKMKYMGSGDGKLGGYRNSKGEPIWTKSYWKWRAEESSCNEFDIIAYIVSTDSVIVNNIQIIKDNNPKYELVGQLRISDAFYSECEENISKNKWQKQIKLTQRIRVKKEGKFVLSINLKTNFMGQTVNFQERVTAVIITEKPKPNVCNGPIIQLPEVQDVVSETDSGEVSSNLTQVCGINPAKIKAIWSDEFNNTLIATREFEERLPSIFGTCNDKVLDLYIKNINLDMYVIDSMAANITSGQRRDEFLSFASRKDGKVQIDDRRVQKLQKHYEQKQKLIAEAVAKTQRKFDEENARLNKDAGKTRNNYSKEEFKRVQDNYVEEFNLNLTDAYRQLGKPKPERLDAEGIYRLTLKRGGWKNVDAYVMESLNNRETLDYTDPETGKKAVIKYEPITVSIKDEVKFDRLLVYVLPDKLNSFMRLKKEGDKFTENLNELMKHNLVCLGYIGEQAYFYSLDGVEPKDYKDIKLLPLSQSELKHNLNRYDNTQRKSLLNDFDYQLFETKENIRQTKLAEWQKFREEIMMVIFPCGFTFPKGQEMEIIEGNLKIY